MEWERVLVPVVPINGFDDGLVMIPHVDNNHILGHIKLLVLGHR